MAYMTWSREWDTGIPVIDRQHLRIVELINELHRAHGSLSHRGVVVDVMSELIEYTQSHFLLEEELQAEAGYPFAKAHQRVHEVFIKKVVGYQARLNTGEDVGAEVADMLEQWLVHHIKGDDADYAPLVKARLHLTEQAAPGWLAATLRRFFKGGEA